MISSGRLSITCGRPTLKPDDSRYRFCVAEVSFQLGLLPEAERALRDVLAIDSLHVEALESLGFLLAQNGKDSEAVGIFDTANSTGKMSATGHYNRGNTLRRLGNYAAALTAYRSALSANPSDESARRNLEQLEEKLRAKQRS